MLDETMTYSCAVFERRRRAARGGAAAQATAGSATSSASARTTACSRSAAAGAASRCSPPSEYGCARHRADDLGRAGGARARAHRRRASTTASRSSRRTTALHEGSYTKIASIEMLEAIGERQFPTYFAAIDRLLEPGGRRLHPDDPRPRRALGPLPQDAGLDRALRLPRLPDPSLSALTQALTGARGSMVHEPRRDRRRTTPRRSAAGARASTRGSTRCARLGYDERFERTWDFYLAFCEAAFRTRALRDVQLTLTRPSTRRPRERSTSCSSGSASASSRSGSTAIEVAGARAHPGDRPGDPRREPRVAARPVAASALVTPRPDPLHGEGRALALPVGRARASTSFGDFPVERGAGDATGDLGAAARCSAQGEVLGIFPQGTSQAAAEPPVPPRRRPARARHRRPARPGLA